MAEDNKTAIFSYYGLMHPVTGLTKRRHHGGGAPESRSVGVDAANIQIRRLGPADAARYRAIRLEGLKESPEAFGSTYEVEAAKPLAWFFERLTSSQVFGAFRGSEILGIAGFASRDSAKETHKGLLFGMYVRPVARGTGVARRLVEWVVDFARSNVELIQLSVVVGNEPARRLYARLGFVEYGIEKNSLKHCGKYYDEILMAKDLITDSDPVAFTEPHADSLVKSKSASEVVIASSD
jgi:RimJ/RimL family protein N-acetyltransferase